MKLIVAGSGSSGNSYILSANDEYLIIEGGISLKEILPLIDFQISKVKMVISSHVHIDHFKYVKDWKKRGIPCYCPFEDMSFIPRLRNSQFKVHAFPLQDADGKWVHSNGDGSECKVYGFHIYHPEMGSFIYASDMEFVKWKFKDINHFLIESNYDLDELESDGEAKSIHVFNGHHSIQAACKFIQANKTENLKSVILCHLSSQNGSPEKFKNMMKEVVGDNVKVYIARKGLVIDL